MATTLDGKHHQIRALKTAVNTFSSALGKALSNSISSIIEKDFKRLSQGEAYTFLNFLLDACSKGSKIKSPDLSVWKMTDSESKVTIERFKKDVLHAIKNLSQERKVDIPVLKKAELFLPNCPRFFTCCTTLANYGLNFILSSIHDIDCWNLSLEELREGIRSWNKENSALNEEFHSASNTLENLKKELRLVAKKKEELDLIAKCLVKNSDPMFVDCVKNCLAQKDSESIIKYSEKVNELHEKNLEKLKLLKKFSKSLEFLKELSQNSHERSVIDGQDFIPLIPLETHAFAEKEGIILVQKGSLNLDGILTVFQRSVSDHAKIDYPDYSNLLEIKLPSSSGKELLSKLERKRTFLQLEIQKRVTRIGISIEKKELSSKCTHSEKIDAWINNLFMPIRAITFAFCKEGMKQKAKEPVADIEKIERIIKIKDYRSKMKESSSVQRSSNITGKTRSSFLRRRRSKSAERFITSLKTDSIRTLPSSQSKNLMASRILREDDFSLKNDSSTPRSNISTLPSSLSTNLMANRILREEEFSLKDELSTSISNINSTLNFKHGTSLTVPEMVFDGEKSISPISYVSQRFTPRASRGRSSVVKRRSSTSSLFSVSLVDLSGPLSIGDYDTTWSPDSKKDNTFDITGEFPDISLDLPDCSSTLSE